MSDSFVEDTEMFFEFAFSKEGDNSVKWKAIENYIKCKCYNIQKLSMMHHTEAPSVKFCEILLNALKKHRCDNKILLTSLIDLVTIISWGQNGYPSIFMFTYKCDDYVKSAINNLKGHFETSVFAEMEGCHVFTALQGNYQYMEILVKYGLVKNISRECQLFKDRTLEIVYDLLFEAHRDDDIDVYDLAYNIIFEVTEDPVFANKIRRNYKRMFFTALALQIAIYKEKFEYWTKIRGLDDSIELDDDIRCLRLYFEAMSDPFVTLSEIKDFLQVCLKYVNKADSVGRYYETYKELIPCSAEKFQPRKLTELSRIQVREYLSSYLPLPMAIENVNLPEKLKDFISFNLR